MVASTSDFSQWLEQAAVREVALSAEQLGLLRAAFHFRQQQGQDYYATRLLSHFLLHCSCGLKVAQIARLLGLSRPTASGYQHLSAKEVIQQAHHRLDGRPHGKLLPRYAGSIAQFLLSQPQATRADLLDFIEQTWSVRVSRIALYKFLKKYGLLQVQERTPVQPMVSAEPTTPTEPTVPVQPSGTASPQLSSALIQPTLPSPPPFCMDAPSMPEPS